MINTDLVADTEHIADDIKATLCLHGGDVGLELTGKQLDALVEFVREYIEVSIETVLEFPEWFDGK